MSDDKVFRTERRSITQAEVPETNQPVKTINPSNDDTQSTFDKISNVQRQLNPNFTSPVNSSHTSDLPSDMPEHLREAVSQSQTQNGNFPSDMPSSFKDALSKTQQTRQGTAPYVSEMSVTSGSSKLQELRAQVKQASYSYEEIQLPSLGRFYDGMDGPKNGIIHVRPMTGHEEEILATPRLVKRGNAVNSIFNRCIQEDYDSDKFLSEDRTYLLIYLRGISYGTNYEVEIKCPECTKSSPYTINLHELYVDNCPEDFNFSCLNGDLPTTQLPYSFRLSRGDDEQRIQDYREKKFRPGQDSNQTDDTLLYRTSLLLENLGGLTNKNEIQLLLKDLPINDTTHLRNTISNPPFGVDTNAEVQCPRCYNEFSLDLPLEASFFFPRGKTKKETRSQ
jgi:hypothetical protein